MIPYAASLKAVGGAKTGIAPVNLLDVQDVNGHLYFWSDRRCNAPVAIADAPVGAALPVALAAGQSVAWAFPTAVAMVQEPGAGTVAATLQSADIVRTQRVLGDTTGITATWSNFVASALPPGAAIAALYPVALVSGNGSGALNGLTDIAIPASGEFDGQFNGGSIGNTLAELAAASLMLNMADSAASNIYQEMNLSFIAIAVYYTVPASSTRYSGAPYKPWLLAVPSFAFHRSLATDVGSFIVQNLSGDTLSRDMEKLLRASAFEGAFFIYRLWQPDAEAAWLEVHGTLTVSDVGADTLTLKGAQLMNPSQDDTPLEIYCETCQIQWGGKRCGSTQATECSYSFQTCQVIERPMIVTNNYEKNFGEAAAGVAVKVINRRRRI